jgi:hypothetical protein
LKVLEEGGGERRRVMSCLVPLLFDVVREDRIEAVELGFKQGDTVLQLDAAPHDREDDDDGVQQKASDGDNFGHGHRASFSGVRKLRQRFRLAGFLTYAFKVSYPSRSMTRGERSQRSVTRRDVETAQGWKARQW